MLAELELELSQNDNEISRENISLYRNAFKMWTYIVAELLCATEKIDIDAAVTVSTEGSSRKKTDQEVSNMLL